MIGFLAAPVAFLLSGWSREVSYQTWLGEAWGDALLGRTGRLSRAQAAGPAHETRTESPFEVRAGSAENHAGEITTTLKEFHHAVAT